MASISDYEIIRKLGQGAMGSVHLVRDNEGATLALKSVAICSKRDRELAANEIRILRSLSHPSIVQFHDSFVHGDDLCIVMEFCPCGDLADLLGRQRAAMKRLPEAEVRAMLAQLTSALAHIHAARIVHRDIKSSNVFVSRQAWHGMAEQSRAQSMAYHSMSSHSMA